MKKAIYLVSIFLTGCVTTPEEPPPPLASLPNSELCYLSVAGSREYRSAGISIELSRRQENCADHMPLVQAKMQALNQRRAAHDAQVQSGMQLLRQAQPQPVAPNPFMGQQCRTRFNNGVAYTDCF